MFLLIGINISQKKKKKKKTHVIIDCLPACLCVTMCEVTATAWLLQAVWCFSMAVL